MIPVSSCGVPEGGVALPCAMPGSSSVEGVLEDGRTYCSLLHELLRETADLYRAADHPGATARFLELAGGIEWFVALLAKTAAELSEPLDRIRCDGEPVKDFLDGLNVTLAAMNDALASGNGLLLAELLDRELSPRILLFHTVWEALLSQAHYH